MAKNTDTQRTARSEYVFKRQPMTMVALKVGVSVATVRRWKKAAKSQGDDWDMARSANMLAGEGLDAVMTAMVEEFVVMAQNLIEEIKSVEDQPLDKRVSQITSLADAMTKMTASASRIAPKLSELAVAQDVARRLSDFIRENYPQHAEAFLEVLEPFSIHIAEVYG